jgi:hypothetical protein
VDVGGGRSATGGSSEARPGEMEEHSQRSRFCSFPHFPLQHRPQGINSLYFDFMHTMTDSLHSFRVSFWPLSYCLVRGNFIFSNLGFYVFGFIIICFMCCSRVCLLSETLIFLIFFFFLKTKHIISIIECI